MFSGVKVTEVQAMVENHLKDMILKTFDPKKADTIFTEEGEVSKTLLTVYILLVVSAGFTPRFFATYHVIASLIKSNGQKQQKLMISIEMPKFFVSIPFEIT